MKENQLIGSILETDEKDEVFSVSKDRWNLRSSSAPPILLETSLPVYF